MADTLSIEARTQLQAAIAALQQMEKALYGVGTASDKAGKSVSATGDKVEKGGKQAKEAAKETDVLGNAVNKLGTAFSAVAIGQFVKSSVDLVIKQQATINVLEATLGSAAKANEEYERLRNTTEVLGIEFFNTAQQYSRFIASAVQAGTSLDSARNTFEGFLIAARGVNLSAFEVELGVRALGQIANKGVVNMEELRQQFAERVPGAMAVTAAALGITTDRLFELTEKGELTADTFFERVGPALAQTFGPAAQKNADSMVAALARMGNAIDRIQFAFANAFAEEMAKAANAASDSSKAIENSMANIGRSIGDMVKESARGIPALSLLFSSAVSAFANIRDASRAAIDGLVGGFLIALSKMSQGMAVFLNALPGVPEAMKRHFQEATVGLKEASDEYLKGAKEALDSYNETTKRGIQSVGDLFGSTEKIAKRATQQSIDEIAAIDAAVKGFGQSTEEAAPLLDDFGVSVDEYGKSLNDVAPRAERMATNVQDLVDRMRLAPGAFDDGAQAVDAFSKRMNQLNKDAELAAAGINKLISEKGLGGLSAGEIASITAAIENLVKKFNFKDIPPEIEALARTFHVSLNPAIDELKDKFLGLDKEIENTITVVEKLLSDSGGALSPAVFARVKDEVERLIKALDFKDIPPRLKALADAFGVSTVSTKKNTEAAKELRDANRELLQEINKVTDALTRQSEASKKAADDSRKEIAELEEKFLTGLDPEELNRLNDLKGKQSALDRQAAKDAEAAKDAQTLLNEANLAAGQTAEAASVQYDKAATSLLGVEQASQNARDRLLELHAAFSASGGAAGRFAVPGGSPNAPGGAVGPQGAIPPGAAPLGQTFGPNANEFEFQGARINPSGPYGNALDGFTQAPIDLFNALDTGTSAFSSEEIAKMMVENMFGSFESQMAQAMADYNAMYANGPGSKTSTSPVRITTKDASVGGLNDPSGGFVGPAQQAQTLITNVEEAADQAGEVLVDSFDDGSKSMFNLGLAAEDTSKSVEGVGAGAETAGQQIQQGLTAPLEGADAAADSVPEGIIAAGEALVGASAAGVDYTNAIVQADGGTQRLGVTAEATAGSIASGSDAARDLAGNIGEAAAAQKDLGTAAEEAGAAQGEALDEVAAKLAIAKGLWVEIITLQRQAAAEL